MQAFQLLTGDLLHEMLADPDNRIGRLIDGRQVRRGDHRRALPDGAGRRPTTEEAAKLVAFVAKAKDRRAALEDVVWGLVNAKEFLLRR